ncbi:MULTISPECIES: hypothetical protein [Providencia]|nr:MULTISPECIES: hypothetical protein [Providencia]
MKTIGSEAISKNDVTIFSLKTDGVNGGTFSVTFLRPCARRGT